MRKQTSKREIELFYFNTKSSCKNSFFYKQKLQNNAVESCFLTTNGSQVTWWKNEDKEVFFESQLGAKRSLPARRPYFLKK